MKYIFKYLAAGIFLYLINGFIYLWHFDNKYFIDEKDFSDWCDNKEFEPPIDF